MFQAGNTSEKRISTVAKFVGKYKTLKEDNIAVAVKELSNVTKDSTNENITKVTEIFSIQCKSNN